jgi:hypothetical protein
MGLLDKFVGNWRQEAVFPQGSPIQGDVKARATFEWTLDGKFLLERTEIDHPDAPNGLVVIAPNPDGKTYTQHYFDSRGVVRLYEMTFDGHRWTLTRERADFTPLDFKQRYTGTFGEDNRTIRGAWEICHDGTTWEKDFELNYTRID